MTYPIDQLLALATANGQLAVKLGEIARETGQDYAQLGAQATSALFAQFKDWKPGTVPPLPEAASSLVEAVEKSREAAVDRTRAAVQQWQGSFDALLSPASGQQPWAEAWESWFRSGLGPFAMRPAAGPSV